MKEIILASTSPRRAEILAKTNLKFDIIPCEYEEDMTLNMEPAELAQHLALGKARSIVQKHHGAIIIGADTFICFENTVLGKPTTPSDAERMLTMLNGKTNEIISGVAVIDTSTQTEKTFYDITTVHMKDVSQATLQSYVKTGEPLDKAGGYAIQGLGAILVEKIEGDFFNAMGLPLSKLADVLAEFGIHILR